MRNFLIYTLLFVVAVVVTQLFVFDSVRVSIWFSPLAYIAFVALLPIGMRPVAVLLLGFLTGAFVDFFEGTAGVHTAVTLLTAYVRRPVMIATMGRETVEGATGMPSVATLGGAKFTRYAALLVAIHCAAFFSLEALTRTNWPAVGMRVAVSGVFTLLAVWAVSLLFCGRRQKQRYDGT